MFKIIFLAFISAASAGVIHDHYGHGGLVVGGPGPAFHGAPLLHAAPVAVKAHVATSYANSNLLAVHPHAVAVAPAPALLHAAPAVVHAPVAPLLLGHGYGAHGYYGHH